MNNVASEIKVPKLLYHYCSTEAFLSIVQSKALWLTDIKNMNDPLEGKWATERLIEICKKNYSKSFKKQVVVGLLEYSITYGIPEAFVACFTDSATSDYHWKNYANEGKGICIAFNTERLGILNVFPRINQRKNKKILIDYLHLCPVIYNEDVQIDCLYKYFTELTELWGDKETEKLNKKFEDLDVFIPMLKNSNWSGEREWRIIHMIPKNIVRSMLHQKKNLNLLKGLHFHMKNEKISPYFIWNFCKEFKNPIEKIIIGQENNISPETISLLLLKNGFTNICTNAGILYPNKHHPMLSPFMVDCSECDSM